MPFAFQIRNGASQDRLEMLIADRLKPNADKVRIDARIWDLFGEEWAVMFTDLSGFSRRVAEFGIIHFLQVIYESQRVLVPCIENYDGILLKMEGDSMLVIFRKMAKALECAIAMQRVVLDYNVGRPETEQILLCVGLGFGAVLRIGDSDVYGAEVNAASKMGEDHAQAWEILVTGAARDAAGELPGVAYEATPYVPPGAATAFRVVYQLEKG